MIYTYTRTGQLVDHADHNWEEWHGYLDANLHEEQVIALGLDLDGNDTGVCCHTCHLVLVEDRTPPAPVKPRDPKGYVASVPMPTSPAVPCALHLAYDASTCLACACDRAAEQARGQGGAL